MGETGDRMDRAGRYVLGLMDDAERERAERDLEIDPAFREAMMTVAERMHVFDRTPASEAAPQDGWRLLKERIAAMPQMRPVTLEPQQPPQPEPTHSAPMPSGQSVTFGRRRSDRERGRIVAEMPPKTIGTGLHSVPSRRALMLALFVLAAFVLGYVTGRL
ncbi:MAG: hypothetical protein M3Y78_03970 [Pseudomonadota bacterium]|nr:hypothetical protein [Pseudomonadota bacterium]